MDQLLKLLNSDEPAQHLGDWHRSGQLQADMPEVDALFGVPQNPVHHPEIDTGIHTGLCLEVAREIGASEAARFAVLVHDLGKALTPKSELPKHVDHETRGLVPVEQLCTRLGVPVYWRNLALLVCEYHLHAHRAFEMRSKSLLGMLNHTGLEFDQAILDDFLDACEADKRGRKGLENRPYLQGQYIRAAAAALEDIPMEPGTLIVDKDTQTLHAKRLAAVRQAAAPFRTSIAEAKVTQC